MYMGKNLRLAMSEQNTFEHVQLKVIDFKGKVVGPSRMRSGSVASVPKTEKADMSTSGHAPFSP